MTNLGTAQGSVRLWAEVCSGRGWQWAWVAVAVTGSTHSLGDPGYQLFSLEHHLVGAAVLDYLPIHAAADL